MHVGVYCIGCDWAVAICGQCDCVLCRLAQLVSWEGVCGCLQHAGVVLQGWLAVCMQEGLRLLSVYVCWVCCSDSTDQ
jgi:hypothetical protein